MWTYRDNWDLIPNINVKSCFKDGVLIHFRLYAANGYVLHNPTLDEPLYDENNNEIGNQPYYIYGGATEFSSYDWGANPKNYHADFDERCTKATGGNL